MLSLIWFRIVTDDHKGHAVLMSVRDCIRTDTKFETCVLAILVKDGQKTTEVPGKSASSKTMWLFGLGLDILGNQHVE